MKSLTEPKISFAALLIALLALIGIYPIFEGRVWGGLLMEIMLSLILLSSVLTLMENRRTMVAGLILLAPPLTLNWISHYNNSLIITSLMSYTTIVFMLFVVIMIGRTILNKPQVTRDSIFGALCIYLLLGIVWALVYSIIELHNPGSLSIDAAIASGTIDSKFGQGFLSFLYFSYVTMTTLGYGDVSPVTPVVQSLSILQAIVGQFYVATVIASLVATHIARRQRS